MSGSDSDNAADLEGQVGLPSIGDEDKEDNTPAATTGEENKGTSNHTDKDGAEEEHKSKKFNKFRDQAKDLVANTEKNKQAHLSNTKVVKLGDDSTTSGSSSANPKHLEINDPRFNYDVILDKGYKLIKKMGSGAYASVFLCKKVDKEDEKCVLKISIGEERIPDTQNEYEILKSLDLYSIPKVRDIILDNDYFYSIICMDYSNIDQNILQYVNSKGSLKEVHVKQAMKELLIAIEYLHKLNYAHRDVKPDNVLLKVIPSEKEGEPDDVKVILVDYNIAKKAKSYRFKTDEDSKEPEDVRFRCNYLTHIASQNSQAPELFKSGYYSESVDIWGAGLVFYTLLTGEKIKRGEQTMIKEQLDDIKNLSDSGRELLHSMFNFEGDKRPTATEALKHPWFHE